MKFEKLLLFAGATIGIGVITYLFNKSTVKKEYHPRLHVIDEIIKNINE